jgi:hypothetical protein
MTENPAPKKCPFGQIPALVTGSLGGPEYSPPECRGDCAWRIGEDCAVAVIARKLTGA